MFRRHRRPPLYRRPFYGFNIDPSFGVVFSKQLYSAIFGIGSHAEKQIYIYKLSLYIYIYIYIFEYIRYQKNICRYIRSCETTSGGLLPLKAFCVGQQDDSQHQHLNGGFKNYSLLKGGGIWKGGGRNLALEFGEIAPQKFFHFLRGQAA